MTEKLKIQSEIIRMKKRSHISGQEKSSLSAEKLNEFFDKIIFSEIFMMKKFLGSRMGIVLIFLSFTATLTGETRVLHVSINGNDSNNGSSYERAFRTIGKAAKVVEPGDTVLVSGGAYFERVRLTKMGTAERPITFKPASHETVVVTYGDPLSGWSKVPGTRCTYQVKYLKKPVFFWESRRLIRYMEVFDRGTLDRSPGSFMYDSSQRHVFAHPLEDVDPESTGFVAVPMNYRAQGGFTCAAPHNRIEGFILCFHKFGAFLEGDGCEASGNTVYACIEGIATGKGNDLKIVANTCFRNDVQGIIIRGGKKVRNSVLIQDNLCYENGPAGPLLQCFGALPMNMAIYGSGADTTFIGNTAIAGGGARGGTWRFKGASGKLRVTNNIMVGDYCELQWGTPPAELSNNTVIDGFLRMYEADHPKLTPELAKTRGAVAECNLYVTKEAIEKAGFANPSRHDYRLRKDSPFLGKGACPQPAPLLYVSPEGDNTNDGTTPQTSLKTLARCLSQVKPGTTVYVMPGTYEGNGVLSVPGTEKTPVVIKSHDSGNAILRGGSNNDGGLVLSSSSHVVIEGLIFQNSSSVALKIEGGGNIKLVKNVFDDCRTGLSIKNADNVSIVNNTFIRCETGFEADDVTNVLILKNNLFSAVKKTPFSLDGDTIHCFFSVTNGFSGEIAEKWLRKWRRRVKEDWTNLLCKVTPTTPDYFLPKKSPLVFAGVGNLPIGAHGAPPVDSPIIIENFKAASIFPERVVFSWTTPFAYPEAVIHWKSDDGKSGVVDVPQDVKRRQATRMAIIKDLTPGTAYQACLKVTNFDHRKGEETITFKTPLKLRTPTTLYVSPQGEDANKGLSAEKAFKTLGAATLAAVPGDTILVASGVYHELVTLWCGGLSPEKRLVLKSEHPGKAVIDCGKLNVTAIRLEGIKHVTIDGFRMRNMVSSGGEGTVVATNVEDFVFVNNIFDKIGNIASNRLFLAWSSRDLVVRNNIFNCGFYGITTVKCDDVVIDHNTFFRCGICAIQLGGKNETKKLHCQITNNIFMDTVKHGKRNPAVCVCHLPSADVVCDYNLYGRNKSPEMALFGYRWTSNGERIGWGEGNAKTIQELRSNFKVGFNSKLGDPMFVAPEAGDFRLKSGSPAIGMAKDGNSVGATIVD